jgi:filamentous hemagglutinin
VLKVDESTSADLRVAAGKMVRTTSGSIEMAASHDVVLAKGTGATPIQAVVYVAGKPSAKPADAAARTQSAWLQFTNHGGRLDVTAGHDVMAEAGPVWQLASA